ERLHALTREARKARVDALEAKTRTFDVACGRVSFTLELTLPARQRLVPIAKLRKLRSGTRAEVDPPELRSRTSEAEVPEARGYTRSLHLERRGARAEPVPHLLPAHPILERRLGQSRLRLRQELRQLARLRRLGVLERLELRTNGLLSPLEL